MRVATAIALSKETRLRLEKLARGRSTPLRIVQRSRIVLLAGDGLQNKQIAERRCLPGPRAVNHGHRTLHRRPQSESKAVHLVRQSHRHPGNGHTRSGGPE